MFQRGMDTHPSWHEGADPLEARPESDTRVIDARDVPGKPALSGT